MLFLFGGALVVQLAPFAQSDGELDPGPLEVKVEGNQRETFLIHQTAQLVDLAAMGQQFAGAQRLVVEVAAGMGVG